MIIQKEKNCYNCSNWAFARCGFDPGCEDWKPDCVSWFDPQAIAPPPFTDVVGLSREGEMLIGEYHRGSLICTGYTLRHIIAWARTLPKPEEVPQ